MAKLPKDPFRPELPKFGLYPDAEADDTYKLSKLIPRIPNHESIRFDKNDKTPTDLQKLERYEIPTTRDGNIYGVDKQLFNTHPDIPDLMESGGLIPEAGVPRMETEFGRAPREARERLTDESLGVEEAYGQTFGVDPDGNLVPRPHKITQDDFPGLIEKYPEPGLKQFMPDQFGGRPNKPE